MPKYVPFDDYQKLIQLYFNNQHPIVKNHLKILKNSNEYIYNQRMLRPKLIKMISSQIGVKFEDADLTFDRYLKPGRTKMWLQAIKHAIDSDTILELTKLMTNSDRDNRKVHRELERQIQIVITQWRSQSAQSIQSHLPLHPTPIAKLIDQIILKSLQLETTFLKQFKQ